MNVLIVSDVPSRDSFNQILILKNEIQENCACNVDLLAFDDGKLILNGRPIGETQGEQFFALFGRLLTEKSHSLIIFSLEKINLNRIFGIDKNVLKLIGKFVPEAAVYVFGASTVLANIAKPKGLQLFLYPRPGVSKLTAELKKDVVERIRRSKH